MTIPIEKINQILQSGFSGMLGVQIQKISTDRLVAIAPIQENSLQPTGVVHGGVYLALAETLAGVGSMLSVDVDKYDVFGIQVSANHMGNARAGEMNVIATHIHCGHKTHIWNVDIFSQDKLLSSVRVTNMIVRKV